MPKTGYHRQKLQQKLVTNLNQNFHGKNEIAHNV